MTNHKVFTDKMFRRLLIPSVASALGLALGDIADALFVGIRLGNLGLATMSIVLPVYMIFNILDVGISVSASVAYSGFLGKGKAKEGVGVFSQMLLLALGVGILLGAGGLLGMPLVLRALGITDAGSALAQYVRDYLQIMFLGAPLTFLYFFLYFCIRCDDDEKTASIGYTVGYLTDVAASIVFILVLHLDVKGAILATVLGKFVGVCIFLTHFLHKWAILRFRWTRPNPKELFKMLRVGFSSSVGYLFQFIVFSVMNRILLRYDGDTAVAMFNVVQNVSYLALAIYTALGETVQPLCSTFYAEHDQAAIRRVTTLAFRIGAAVGGVLSVLFAVFAPAVCRFFGLSEAAVPGGAHAVGLFCLSVVPAGFSIIIGYCYQAVQREREVFFINLLRTLALNLLFILLLSAFPVRYFWFYAVLTEGCCLAIWMPIAQKKSRKIHEEAESTVFSEVLDANKQDISALLDRVEAFCEERSVLPKQMYCVSVCIEEMCEAIIGHAFQGVAEAYIHITVAVSEQGEVSIHIRDNAVSFNPFSLKTGQNYLENEEDLDSLGIQMVKKKAKRFFYRRYTGFNTLTVVL